MSAYCIKVFEHGDFLTSVFKQEQYMSIFLAAHVLLVSVLNPCFLLHAHFFCAPQKNIDWKTAFYSFCYFRMLLFIELLIPSLLCSTLRSALTATLTLQISPHATGQCLFLYSCCLHWMSLNATSNFLQILEKTTLEAWQITEEEHLGASAVSFMVLFTQVWFPMSRLLL